MDCLTYRAIVKIKVCILIRGTLQQLAGCIKLLAQPNLYPVKQRKCFHQGFIGNSSLYMQWKSLMDKNMFILKLALSAEIESLRLVVKVDISIHIGISKDPIRSVGIVHAAYAC